MLNNISTFLYSMLTKNQCNLIAERKGGKDKDLRGGWKAGDYALRQALKNRLDSMKDVSEIFDVLPDKQIKNVLTVDQMIDILRVVKKLLDLCPPVQTTRTPEDGLFRVNRRFTVDMGSRIRGLDNALVGTEVTYLANEDERLYWSEFHDALHSFTDIVDKIAYDPKRYTQKEFNNLIKPIIENREDVHIESGNWYIGDPKENFREVNPMIDAERNVLSMKSKKMVREKNGSDDSDK